MPQPITNLQYFWKKKAILSFFAVIFVVYIHSSATEQYIIPADSLTNLTFSLRNFIAYNLGSFAVPFFFFVSGITMFRNYSNKSYVKKLNRRIKSLLIPYLIWNLIGLIFAIFYTYTPLSNIISGREAFAPTITNILEGIFLYKYNFHFWFLFNLIIFTLLAPIFHYLTYNKPISFLFAIIFFLLPLATDSFLRINTSFIVFYYLGCYIGKYHLKSFTRPIKSLYSLIFGLILILTLVINTLISSNILPSFPLLSQIILIILVLSIWLFSDIIIKKTKPLTFVNETFPIYTIHVYFIATITKVFFLLLPKTSPMLLLNEILSPLITVVIVTFVTYFWHRKLPKSYNLFFGNHQNNTQPLNNHT